MTELTTTTEVLRVLGGVAAVAELTGNKVKAVEKWQQFETFPSKTYVALQAALGARGYAAPASLWRMVEAAS